MTQARNSVYKKAIYVGEKATLLDMTIGQKLEEITKQNPNHPALIMPQQNIHWSYEKFNAQVDRLAAGLVRLGIGIGDRVGIWSPNRVEWVLTQFATAKIGAIMVCVNPAYRLFELEYVLNKVGCKALITAESFKTSMYLDMLLELAPELETSVLGKLNSEKLPHLKIIIRMGDAITNGMYNFNDVLDMGTQEDKDVSRALSLKLSPVDHINIQFTSGTTGTPKGATLSHSNILNNAYFSARTMNLTANDRLCIPVPLYHCFGMVLGSLLCVSVGATMIFPGEGFEAEQTLRVVSEEKCTALHGVPTMFIAQLDLPNFKDFDVGPLRTGIIAGSTCPVELMNRLINDMELTEIVIGYGQTECSPINTMTAIDDTFEQRVSTVGRAHYNWEQRILREDGTVAAVGEQGEICSRGYGVMAGYWNEPERTAETIDSDGFLHSGDLGEMDHDGYVKVTGRIKDMIIRGGENIYPREVEEYLYTHPQIAEAQVFGIPDEKYGEQVCAWVQLRPGSNLSSQDIRTFCQGQITHFKVPKIVKIVTEFPMTVTGKMQKFVMRDQMIEELG
ncbi:AMP-binding protein [Hellea balneolensis]|uniref:AMP-binding protein n=1 Tax=Hellea balneolensis TaxID=287478 RepID=UPI0004085370|nr:AMP-binding protein [Hellea balneolensis]